VFDRTTSGSTLKWLSIVDEFTRECLCLKVDRSITSEDVIDTLAELPSADELCTLAPEYLNPHWPMLNAPLVQRWHADGYAVSCWTVDSPSTMAHLIDMSVDVIITNRIGHLVNLIAARGVTAPAEPGGAESSC